MRGVRSLLNAAAGPASGDSPQESGAQHRKLRGSMAIDALAAAQVRGKENQHAFQRRQLPFVPVGSAILTALSIGFVLAMVFGIA